MIDTQLHMKTPIKKLKTEKTTPMILGVNADTAFCDFWYSKNPMASKTSTCNNTISANLYSSNLPAKIPITILKLYPIIP